jgi:hypothetical protein
MGFAIGAPERLLRAGDPKMNSELRRALVGFVAGVLLPLILRQLRQIPSRSAWLNCLAKATMGGASGRGSTRHQTVVACGSLDLRVVSKA